MSVNKKSIIFQNKLDETKIIPTLPELSGHSWHF